LSARRLRSVLGAALIATAAILLLPDPAQLRSAPVRATHELLDPSLRVPFAAASLRAPAARLRPGERVLGIRRPGDAGLVVPRDRHALLDSIGSAASLELEVQGAGGARRVRVELVERSTLRALLEQWPLLLSTAVLLAFSLACILGGRHPVATPLFAVTLCLAVALGSAIDLVLPQDTGLLGWTNARARIGTLAWCALPAALLHLAARFPVVVPSFRRPALAAVPYALWAVPGIVAQLRFGEAVTVDAVERVALTASFVSGTVLVAVCAFPGRPLSPVERVRARAALAAFVTAGAGPLVAFVYGGQPTPTRAALLALGGLALPLALGWAVVRYRLLDPPEWLRRTLVSGATTLVALLLAAIATGAAWEQATFATQDGSAPVAALALATALSYQAFRSATRQQLRPSALRAAGSQRLLTRASRELAGATSPHDALERFVDVVCDALRPGAVEAIFLPAREPVSVLAERGLALWQATPAAVARGLIRPARGEDPERTRPEAVLALEPRSGPVALVVVAARADGLPYSAEELRALEDAGRLATLALADAAASAHLEAAVVARTAALAQALRDRGAVVAAAEEIQAAAGAREVRAAALRFLARCTGHLPLRSDARLDPSNQVVLQLELEPTRASRFAVDGLEVERAADLQPQADTVAALAGLALERIHLLAELKHEVAAQARELARVASGERCAAFVREVAHELRKPAEEIRDLAQHHAPSAVRPARDALERIETLTRELSRRLDCLLSRGATRLDLRRVDLVRIADEAIARAERLRCDRHFEVVHAGPRLPLVGDPVRLASLLENLIDNACKATRCGGRVGMRTALVATPACVRAVLEVEDDGVGIPPDLGEDIFEPGVGAFRQGFGLGLALCRDVARAHGGAIAVASAPGRTVFRIELPQAGPEEP
jgi:two-component system nitrogen regulation sensor histidine kinase GlnL